MKPYGRVSNLKGSGVWKTDYRVRRNNRKIGNWWEDIIKLVSRTTLKRMWRKEYNI